MCAFPARRSCSVCIVTKEALMKRGCLVVLPISLSAALLLSCWRSFAQSGAWQPPAKNADAVRVLVVTGGHDHDADFYSVFADDRLRAVVDPHPAAFRNDIRRRADVLVLYDHMPDSIEDARRKNLQSFAESGKGIVILHHAICSHVKWPWWYEEVAGGRWLFEPANGMPVTTYKHDEEIDVKIAGDHPITRGLKDFRIH